MFERMKFFFFYCVLIMISVGLSLVFLELGARGIVYGAGLYLGRIDPAFYRQLQQREPPYQFPQRFYQPDRKTGRIHTPGIQGIYRGYAYPWPEYRNLIRINSAGFRSSREYNSAPDKLRVAVLGDSFVEALHVQEDQSFSKVMEQSLAEQGTGAEVYNYGMANTGTVHHYATFMESVRKGHPQVLVLAFFHNDFVDSSPVYAREDINLVPQYGQAPDGQVVLEDFGVLKAGQNELDNWHFKSRQPFISVVNIIIPSVVAAVKAAPYLVFPKLVLSFLVDRFFPVNNFSVFFDVYRKEYPPALQDAVGKVFYFLQQIRDVCAQDGIKFVVVMIPSMEQVRPYLWDAYLQKRAGFLSPADFDLQQPYKVLQAQLHRLNIPYLDLTGPIRDVDHKHSLYYSQDRHWNRKGHELAGRLIAQHLQQTVLPARNAPGR